MNSKSSLSLKTEYISLPQDIPKRAHRYILPGHNRLVHQRYVHIPKLTLHVSRNYAYLSERIEAG